MFSAYFGYFNNFFFKAAICCYNQKPLWYGTDIFSVFCFVREVQPGWDSQVTRPQWGVYTSSCPFPHNVGVISALLLTYCFVVSALLLTPPLPPIWIYFWIKILRIIWFIHHIGPFTSCTASPLCLLPVFTSDQISSFREQRGGQFSILKKRLSVLPPSRTSLACIWG